jgi:thiosulfate/3-mercaptopyruvate sulfurtransferase
MVRDVLMPSPLLAPDDLQDVLAEAVLLDVRTGPDARARYREGHLPGAHFVDLETQLAAPTDRPELGGRHPLPDAARFAEQLGRWGIGDDTRVVVYDDAGGANAAARAWWMLKAMGHEQVQVLDGGLSAARGAGVELSAEIPTEVDGPPSGARAYRLSVASLDEVDAARRDPKRRVLDARSAPRYRGEEEPIDPVAGHIPGAVNLFHGEHLGERGRFLPAAEVRAQLERALGGVPSERAVVHCGSGVTACQTLLAMAHAGLPLASLYVGSWSEWCRREKPRATGPEPSSP